MVESGLLATIGFAASAGVATFFAPCAYPLLPGYVGYYISAVEGTDDETDAGSAPPQPGRRARLVGAFVRGLAASLGVLVTFAVLGAVVSLVGRPAARYLVLFEPVVGVAFVVLGALLLADRAPTIHVPLPARRTSILGFAGFGAVYALAAAGCTVPILLAIVLRALSLPAVEGLAVVVAYALGVGLMLLAATIAIAVGHDIGVRRLPGLATQATRIAGAIILLAGLAQLYASVVSYNVVGVL